MSYLSFIFALIQFLGQDTSGLTTYQSLDQYLDMVVFWELFFIKLSLGGAVVAAIIFVFTLVATKELGRYCGCFLLVLGVVWPIMEIITYFIASGLADSVTAAGIVNPVKFWLLVFLMALLGSG